MRPLLVALLVALVTAGSAAPAMAADEDDPPPGLRTSSFGNASAGGGSISSHAFETVSSSSGGGGGSVAAGRAPAWLQYCTYDRVSAGSAPISDPVPVPLEEESWVLRCPPSVLDSLGGGVYPAGGILAIYGVTDPAAGFPPGLVDVVIREAARQVPLKVFYPSSAPEGTEEIPLITRFETMLWIDEAEWQPVSAVASVPGLTVTATATPVEARWTGGDDPTSVTCDQAGPPDTSIPWDDQDFSCSMYFHHSSTVQDYELTVEVTWEVTYVCSAICGTGTLEPQVTVGSKPVLVGEIQALVTSYG